METIERLAALIEALEKRVKKLELNEKPINVIPYPQPVKPYMPTQKEIEERPWDYFKERTTWL